MSTEEDLPFPNEKVARRAAALGADEVIQLETPDFSNLQKPIGTAALEEIVNGPSDKADKR